MVLILYDFYMAWNPWNALNWLLITEKRYLSKFKAIQVELSTFKYWSNFLMHPKHDLKFSLIYLALWIYGLRHPIGQFVTPPVNQRIFKLRLPTRAHTWSHRDASCQSVVFGRFCPWKSDTAVFILSCHPISKKKKHIGYLYYTVM